MLQVETTPYDTATALLVYTTSSKVLLFKIDNNL